MILIGGRFSMLGPAIGAGVAMFMPEIINAIFGDLLPFSRIQIIFGLGLIITVLFSPNGITGQAKQRYHTIANWWWKNHGAKEAGDA